jgi:predicted metal-dependent RNase
LAKVVMASFGSLEAGPSRHLFAEWAADPRNLVVLTDRMQCGTLARDVAEMWKRPPGRGLHSSTSLLNLSRFWSLKHQIHTTYPRKGAYVELKSGRQ